MIYNRIILITVLFAFGLNSTFAQSDASKQYLDDINLMSSTLGTTQQYSLELTISAHQNSDQTITINSETERVLVQKDGERTKVERDGNLVIRDGNVVLLIDNENKTIASVEDSTNFANVNISMYEAVLESYPNSIRLTKSTNLKRIYQMRSDKGEIKFLEAEFDINKGIFVRSYVELRNSPIGVENIEVNCTFRKNAISGSIPIELYLLPINSDTIQIAPAYRDYTYLSRRIPSARPVVLEGA